MVISLSQKTERLGLESSWPDSKASALSTTPMVPQIFFHAFFIFDKNISMSELYSVIINT